MPAPCSPSTDSLHHHSPHPTPLISLFCHVTLAKINLTDNLFSSNEILMVKCMASVRNLVITIAIVLWKLSQNGVLIFTAWTFKYQKPLNIKFHWNPSIFSPVTKLDRKKVSKGKNSQKNISEKGLVQPSARSSQYETIPLEMNYGHSEKKKRSQKYPKTGNGPVQDVYEKRSQEASRG